METQALNINENSKENLKKGATIAGAAMAGAGAVVTAEILTGDEDIEMVDAVNDATATPGAEQSNANNTTAQAANSHNAAQEQAASATTTQSAQAAGHAAAGHTAAETTAEPQPQATVEEPSGTNEPSANGTTANEASTNGASANEASTNGASANEASTNEVNAEVDVNDIPDVDPTLVAQNLTDDVIMVDPTDIDMENMDIAAVGTVQTVDGEVLTAAQFIGDNGETLYMVDVNGNGSYDVVTDDTGNVLADVPSTLTVSDTESIVSTNNDDYGYLAQNDSDNATDAVVDNAMDDVVDLG